MVLTDSYYNKQFRSKTTDLAKGGTPLKSVATHTHLDLKWPDDGKGKTAENHSKLSKKIGVVFINRKEGQFESLVARRTTKLGKLNVKLYESSPKNKNPPLDGTWKIGGDVRYRVNTFRIK